MLFEQRSALQHSQSCYSYHMQPFNLLPKQVQLRAEGRVDRSLFEARFCAFCQRQQQTAQANTAACPPGATQQRLFSATPRVGAVAREEGLFGLCGF